jgi:2-methylcitrate dehydratase PrpD
MTTKELVDYVLQSDFDHLPMDVVHEAKRALLNIVGCALGGSTHPAVEIAIDALGFYAGKPTSQVLGRTERFDPLFASVLNGISSHVHDYDDTLPRNYIHASSPVASALFAYASMNPVRGQDFLHAFVLGFEVISRIGDATYPAHYQAGWHSTATIGVFGAAAAIGRLLRLTPLQMTYAIGLAATQAAGIREMFGTMAKTLHPGRSAQSGYMAALLAQKNFTAALQPIEGPRGFAAVQSSTYDLSKITRNIGDEFALRFNTYKPFPCGIVIHPTIDACIQLRDKYKIEGKDVAEIDLRVAPLVKDLCNKRVLREALESKFSIYHAAAIGLERGKGGLAEFTDEAINDPALKRLREVTDAHADDNISEDAVSVQIRLTDGSVIGMELEQSLGNLARPLSDRQLEDKFREQATVLAAAQIDAAMAACWNIDRLDDVRELIACCSPRQEQKMQRAGI